MKSFNLSLLTETQKYALLGGLFGLVFPIIATILRISNSNLPFQFSSLLYVQTTDSLLWIIDSAPIFLGFFAAIAGRRQDNLQQVNKTLRQRESELENAKQHLEQRVSERTHELLVASQQIGKRAEQLSIIADVARSAISIQDVDQLLPYVAKLISDRFNVYHVGIFLLDEQSQYSVLRASNSEGGVKMLALGHRLKVGEQGIVGFVTQSGQARIASDVGTDAKYFNNPNLPETHSEIALPLKSGDIVIGALDIQSTQSNAFSQDDISTLSILADQVSIAILNAISHEESQRALREAEAASSQLINQAWKGFTNTIQAKGYRYDGVKSEALNAAQKSLEGQDTLLVPVQLRGQTIGHLKLKASDATRKWTDDERAIIEATAERAALAMEGARLLDQAQKRAARETFLSEVGTKLGTSFQLDSILRDTVEELGQNLKGSTVSFQLVNPSAPPTADTPKADGASARRKKSE
ncbi:MAG: GAF domain-containing protein [Chloroflexota bacterium]